MPDSLRTFQDTIHHTVKDTIHTAIQDTVKYFGRVMNNPPAASSWTSNPAIWISLFSVLFTGLGFYWTYRMRKKDFQTEIYKKQFEAYDKIVRLINQQYSDIQKALMEYIKNYKQGSEDATFGELINALADSEKTFNKEVKLVTYLINYEVLFKIWDYQDNVSHIFKINQQEMIEHFTGMVRTKLEDVEDEIRNQLSIDKLNTETINLLDSSIQKKIKERQKKEGADILRIIINGINVPKTEDKLKGSLADAIKKAQEKSSNS
jgi:hypothetical protein